MNTRLPSKISSVTQVIFLTAMLGLTPNSYATDLAPAPLVTTPTASVLPNIFLMMDDSGSMNWDYMPDNAGNFGTNTYGAASSQCNGIFYNPAISYIPPVDATGVSYANATFTAAWTNGYSTAAGSTNLSTSFTPTGGGTAAPAYYYRYTGTQTTEKLKDYYNSASTFYKECNSTVGSTPGSAVFTKVVVAAAEQTNFANWYSYYRTRIMMMKTSTGLAFKTIGSNFRVGLATMNNNTGADFLSLAPFTAAQKTSWYAKLYATTAGNSTPLREALSNVGRMYAMKLPSNTLNGVVVADPIEYSCQQNFTILTTDGFWNGSTTYNLAGTTVGNQDGAEVRPMYDGANQSTQAVTTTNTTVVKQSIQNMLWTIPYNNVTTTVSATKNCATGAALPTSCVTDVNGRTWCMYTSNGVNNTSRCGGAMGAGNAFGCRLASGATATSTTPNGSACVADSGGQQQWCVYTDNTTGTSCGPQLQDKNGNVGVWVCKPATVANGGYTVTTQTTSQIWSENDTVTTVTNNPSTTTSTVVTNNGVALAPVVSTTAGAVTTVSSTWLYNSGAWGAVTGPVTATSCQAVPPVAGTTPSWGTWTQTNTGPATVTTLSTTSSTLPTVYTTSSSGGTFDTLADVAEYYYITDLRTVALGNNISGANATDISNNNVPSSGSDTAAHQHMTTFTLGLGARGRMVFDPSYQTASSGDFFAVKQGSTANAASGVCTWQADNTTCNWPTPASNAIENVDDLWHTAVNGRGAYFSAANPSDLSLGLTSALAGVSARLGSSAAATTSTAFITQGDNFLFRSSYVSMNWVGELIRQQLDVNTGAVLPTVDWSAQAKLDLQTTRTIYFFDPASTTKLSPFLWANLNATQQGYFSLANIQTLTQSCVLGTTCLSAASQTLAAGANLVNFIRGDRSNEGALADNTKYYHQRLHVLGDIVNSESVYIKGAFAAFTDAGYAAFKSSTTVTTRKAMVYVGSNDGMLHAFRASDDPTTPTINEGGQEDWAYIPSMVMPNLYKLADKGYDLKHQYYVDGSPVAADICFQNCGLSTTAATDWKTILVGGLNFGGKGYYALDVTDPANPKALWEFTDANMGYSYGNPKVVKLKNGTWVVVITSGYNNVPPDAPSGDGNGRLYVLNANTGALISTIATSVSGVAVGSAATPNGLARIDVAVANPGIDATSVAAYGGDVLGNLWRFDINGADTQTPARWTDIGAAGIDAQLLATLQGPANNIQPITAKPLITLVGTTYVINVGTGRYLGSSDLVDTSQQSFYAIKDTFGTTVGATYPNPRNLTTFVRQTQTATTCPPNSSAAVCSAGQSVTTSSNAAVDFSTKAGWYLDFARAGERNNTDPAIMQGTLLLTTNIPNSTSCSVGGDSYLYQLDYRTGGAVSTSGTGVTAIKLGNELASRPVVASLADGTSRAYVQGSGGLTPSVSTVLKNDTTDGVGRRVSWRELIP